MRFYCPGCEPETDPIKEVVSTRYCGVHIPSAAGSEDKEYWTYQLMEAGDVDNKKMCDLIHRPEST